MPRHPIAHRIAQGIADSMGFFFDPVASWWIFTGKLPLMLTCCGGVFLVLMVIVALSVAYYFVKRK